MSLASINLPHFVEQRDGATKVDWERLRAQVHDGVRFLDDVISVNRFPLEEVVRITLANREIGLGVMGFAELCILLGISYAIEQAIRLAEKLMGFRSQVGVDAVGGAARGLSQLGQQHFRSEWRAFTECYTNFHCSHGNHQHHRRHEFEH